MDSIVSSAIEEVCARAAAGIPLTELWPTLRGSLSAAGLPPSAAVNRAIWARLLTQPGIRFEANGSPIGFRDPSIQSLEEAERIGIKIVAGDQLRDNFLGIYDLKAASSEISQIQRATLERLAASRTSGVTQSELGKEFGIKGNNLFYIVRNLESQQLIVRQPTIVRAKESGTEGEIAPENTSVVSTNLLHLHRYAKNMNLNLQQRFEITRADILDGMGHANGSSSNVGEGSCDFTRDDVSVKDYVPAMKAICDKLEEACGKVLIVSDIKTSLGYRKTPGHRAWRNILQRLKDAHLVEEFQAEVKDRVVSCLRLLKKFDFSDFQPKKGMHSHDSFDNENLTKIGKRGHITDQLVELPLEHCIYDMVDAEGQKGLTIVEVSRRLGFTTKKLYKRISSMRERFRMRWQAEMHEKTPIYRIWTFENYPRHSSDSLPGKQEAIQDKNDLLFQSKNLTLPLCQSENLCSTSKPLPVEKEGSVGLVPSNISPGSYQDAQEIKSSEENSTNELPTVSCDPKPSKETVPDMNAHQSKEIQFVSSTSFEVKMAQRHRSFPTMDGTKREERIVKMLEKERFILAVELHRWLEGLEKGKHTKMCKKTLFHTLNKLQKEGLCRCIQVSIPVVTNFNRHRITEVILHPSLQKLSPELLEKIYKKQRDFDVRIRVHASAKSRNGQPVHKLADLIVPQKNVDDRNALIEAMRANGYASARMIRAKLLHKFLWSYVSNSPNWLDAVSCYQDGYDLKSPQSTCHFFALDEAIKRMPLELFLQVVGSPKEIENMVERCRLGLRLSDIPFSEYKSLFDVGATYRLSNIINILVRMKLIQLAREGLAEDNNGPQHAVLTYAMEMKPYIEEPMAQMLVPSHVKADLRPRIRHDFILLKPEAVDVYWETLEYCFAAANKEAASHAFPGSSAHEVFQTRSWTSLRVMTIEQRMELLQRVNNVNLKNKIPFKDCVRIARELNLTVEQVLRVSYDKRQSRLSRYSSILKYKVHGNHIGGDDHESFDRKRKRKKKRKRSSKDESLKDDFEQNEPVGSSKQKIKVTPGVDAQSTESSFCSQADNENDHSACREHNNDKHAVDTEDGGSHAFIGRAFPRQVMRAKRFFWTDSLDRQLVMQYARQRAVLGARFYRVDWTSLSDLPALPGTCGRRMAVLNSNSNVRRAVMRLCNLLGARYANYLEKARMMKEKESLSQNFPLTHENVSETNFQQCFWDDFDDPEIKMAVDEVLRYKRLAKVRYVKRIEPKHGKEWPDFPPTDGTNLDSQHAFKQQNFISECYRNESQKSIVRCKNSNALSSPNKSNSRHSQGNLVKILNSRSIIMKKKVCESLAVANAVELLKLVFLSTSASPEVQSSLVATLQLYSESDIFAAFNYLKEMNFMVVGHGSQPFVLSKKFWHHASSSPFPVDSGKRADELSDWLGKKENDLMEDGVSLTRDLQCGEICHLFALISTGEFSISPCLPKEGIGEADELVEHDKVNYSNNLKRRTGEFELGNFKKVKKPRFEMKTDKDYCCRREKGFPGIKVVLNRKIIAQAVTFCPLREKENLKCSLSDDKNSQGLSCEGNESTLLSNLMYQNFGSGTAVLDRLPWDAVISYAESLAADYLGRDNATKFSPELFKSVHTAVSQAGGQGLNMKEISEAVDMLERKLTEVIVDTLELFQVVIKVNSYDDVRILDSSHKFKYYIQSPGVQSLPQMSSNKHSRVANYGVSQQTIEKKADVSHYFQESSKNVCDGHKVTILDLPNDTIILDVDGQDNKSGDSIPEESTQAADSDHGKDVRVTNLATVSERHVCRPILPWINGDGSTNTIVYKGLTRRVLGTVMQNPGILEEDIIGRMDVLNPQTCRRLVELMILDNHLTVRMLPQTPPSAPNMLRKLFGSKLSSTKPVLKKHFFANPQSTSLL